MEKAVVDGYLERYLSKDASLKNKGAIAYLAALDFLGEKHPEVANSIISELNDQRSYLKMIASENYSSLAVQLAMGNLLTDKYSEGYAHHRFYAGCENVDAVEERANQQLQKLYECDHAYVQPHSGADANLVAFWSILVHKVQNSEVEKLGKKSIDELTPEDYEKIRQVMMSQKLMGMSLNSGGHLTHGYRHNLSSKMFQSATYEVNFDTGLLDYSAIAEQAKIVKPLILLAGYSAYPRLVNFAKLKEIAESVGAVLMVDMAHFSGLVAGKVLKGEYNPIPYADFVTSTTHKTLRGPRGGMVMCKKEFAETVNKGCPLVLGGPLPHVMAAKAIAFEEANSDAFRKYSQEIVNNSKALADELMKKGLKLLTNGTDNHMVIIDLGPLGLTGRHGENILRDAHITVNRNAIPNDPNGPWYTSGVRIGTPALTTLGMGTSEMKEIAGIISEVLQNSKPSIVEKTGLPSKAKVAIDQKILEKSKLRVKELLKSFPLYPEIVMM